MNLDEALAVLLYQQYRAPGKRDEAIYLAAWQVVCKSAIETQDRINFPALAGTR